MGIQKVRTSPYHAQTKGQVEWAPQILMHMIGKLSKDQKVDCPKHLSRLVHAYNAMRSAITRYSLHYLMIWCWAHLPIDFYFSTIRGMKNTSLLTTTLLSYVNNCRKPLKRLKCSPCHRCRDRSSTMIGKLMLLHWNQVTWSWLKPMPIERGGKWRTSGRMNHTKWGAKLQKASLPTL